MKFAELEQQARTAINEATTRGPLPEPPPAHRPGRGPLIALAAAAAVAAVVVLVAVATGGAPTSTTAVPAATATPAPTVLPVEPTSTSSPSTTAGTLPVTASGVGIWSIEQPPRWHRSTIVDGDVMIVTLATLPLGTEAPECSGIRGGVIDTMGPDDELVHIVLRPASGARPQWPDFGLDPTVFFDSEVLEPLGTVTAGNCLSAVAHRTAGSSRIEGGVEAIVLTIGPDVGSNVEPVPGSAELLATAGSLRLHAPDADRGFACLTTRASDPGHLPPDSHPRTPASLGDRWYGTDELWTVLAIDGTYPVQRKSVWWSANFPGGRIEQQPELEVVWQRLDRPAEPVFGPFPATNASSAEEGDFMIAGIDPDQPGCWQVTATYKGTTLGYVYAKGSD